VEVVLGIIGLLVVVLVVSSVRRVADRRSIERYHRAMDVLGEISGHGRAVGGVGMVVPKAGVADRPPLVEPDEPRGELPDTRREIPGRAPIAVFASSDEDPTPTQAGRVATRRALPWSRPDSASRRQPSRRPVAVFATAVLVLALVGVGVGVALTSSSGPSRLSAAPPSRVSSGHPGRRGIAPRSTSSTTTSSTSTTTSTTVPSTTSSTTVVRSGSGTLALAALSPDAATAGESVTLSGSGFIGAHGYVAATFDGRVVPTRCPSEEMCIATVPAGLSGSVTVRLQTASGSSNGLSFRYV
jgi:hypothetical protein